MTAGRGAGRQPVVVVTGGGGGIGAAIAEELGRRGCFVVTMDPLVTLDGAEQLPAPEETTAGRIVAAGGSARASSVSVTDRDAVRALFEGLVDELGGLDGVVNVAGITRPTTFAKGTEEDWLAVLSVHLDGYLNVLGAALPVMAAAGHGRILGVTSGSGWRAADTGAYGCAKRAVASLTWQLGRSAPPGVAVNAISPIAVTRMVTAALGRRAGGGGSGSSTGGLSLGSMPEPEHLGPLGAHLVADEVPWCNGCVIFAGGSEVAVIDEPRLLEVVRTDEVPSLPAVFEAITPALVAAEAGQTSGGGSNPRFGSIFDDGPAGPAAGVGGAGAVAIVSDRPDVAASVTAALDARGVSSTVVEPGVAGDFASAAGALAATAEQAGPLAAVVVALGAPTGAPAGAEAWRQALADHEGLVEGIHADARWARAASDHAVGTGRSLRLVVLTDATTAGGRSRAQAAAQLTRAARGATDDRLSACAVSVETSEVGHTRTIGELAAHLVCSPDAPGLSGAELVAGAGWVGLRSHPHPGGSVTFGGPEVPDWLDDALGAMVGTR